MHPGVVVDAVVEEPFACHPSFAQGYYDRDNAFYVVGADPRDPTALEAWLREWVYELGEPRDYVEKRGDADRQLRPEARDVGRGRLRGYA